MIKAPTPPDIPFPLDAFPPTIAPWLHHTAAITRVPASAIAYPFLAGAGATIGNQLGLELAPGWIEYPTLWVALVGATGLGKTPALAAAREPFDNLHDHFCHTWNAANKAAHRPFQKRTELPPFDRLFFAGGSIDDLACALGDSRGLFLFRDELFGVIRALDRHSGADRQTYLSLWSAEIIDLPSGACLVAPTVSLAGGLLPSRLQTIHRRERDGLLERFLLIFLSANIPPWNWELDPIAPGSDSIPIVEILKTLRAIPAADEGGDSHTVTLGPDAAAAWEAWFNANTARIHAAPPTLAGFTRKLPAHLARVALILHALWNPATPTLRVSGETLRRAIDLIEYAGAHLQHAAALLDEPPRPRHPKGPLESRILNILHTDPDVWMGRSQLLQALGRPETSAFDSVVAAMLNRERIETRTTPGRGRTATEFRLRSPDLLAKNTPQEGSGGHQKPIVSG